MQREPSAPREDIWTMQASRISSSERLSSSMIRASPPILVIRATNDSESPSGSLVTNTNRGSWWISISPIASVTTTCLNIGAGGFSSSWGSLDSPLFAGESVDPAT